MKLFHLLDLMKSLPTDGALPDNFGDSYLYRHNGIFRNIREATLKAGFTFNNNPDHDFLVFPLSQLEKIMKSRKIPYLNNVDVLRAIENQRPRAIEVTEIKNSLKKNYIFHESCHAVGRSLAQKTSGKNEKLDLMIEESFANTCELFGMLEASDPAHRIFYEFNSYTALYEVRTNLKNACSVSGLAVLFQFFIFGYLHSNYLFSAFSDKDFSKVFSIVSKINGFEISAQEQKIVRSLLKVCFTLDLEFRTTTTDLHLKLSGAEIASGREPDAGYLSYFTEIPEYTARIKKLSQTALGDLLESH